MTIVNLKRKVPVLLWLPVGYLLLAAIHAVVLQLLPLPAAMPEELAVTLQQQPVTLAEIDQSVERLTQLKKLAEL